MQASDLIVRRLPIKGAAFIKGLLAVFIVARFEKVYH